MRTGLGAHQRCTQARSNRSRRAIVAAAQVGDRILMRWPKAWWMAGLWALPGLYFAVQVYLQHSDRDHPLRPSEALGRGVFFSLLWAVSSPLIVRLARAVSVITGNTDRRSTPSPNSALSTQHSALSTSSSPSAPARGHWTDGLLLHLPVGTIFSLAHLLVYVLVISHMEGRSPRTFDALLAEFQPVFFDNFAWWSLVYWTFLLAIYAFDFHERYQAGLLRATQLEAQLAQSELQALKMQLHPHFLFNTLNSIAALMHEDPDTADRMIARLGDFLRLTIQSAGAHTVALAEELKFLEYYLAIERLRFQDRLATAFEVEPDALSVPVPNLLLQPIVENAIRHGVAQIDRPGRLVIRARRSGEMLLLEVEDNGPGINSAPDSASGLNVGLANTRARLEALYGANHRLELMKSPEGGVLVQIGIPLQTL
ncbi:MAG: histidine kinase [Blastocatellales bacterium]|nr:histidine kinase [Blastocatellales bacterium]